MKEKLTYFVVATVFLLILILIRANVLIPNEVGKHITHSTDIILTCQTNCLIEAYNSSLLIISNVSESTKSNRNQQQGGIQSYPRFSEVDNSFNLPFYHILEYVNSIFVYILNTAITCYGYLAECFHKNAIFFSAFRRWCVIRLFSKSLYINKLSEECICQLKTRRVLIQKRFHPSEVLNFMIAITFVKLVIVAIAYQQLLYNGYIIIQNLYHKHTRQSETLVCNRPYQLKSGHGLDDEENYMEQQLLSASDSQKTTHIISFNSAQMVRKPYYENASLDKKIIENSVRYSGLRRPTVDRKSNQLYHQQQHSSTHYCYKQTSVAVNHYNVNYRINKQISHYHCLCQQNCSNVELEQTQSTLTERYVNTGIIYNCNSFRKETKVSMCSIVSSCRSRNLSVTTIEAVASLKVSYYNRPQLMCVNRKSRKKKDFTYPEEMYDMSDMLWQRFCAFSWCCNGFCNIFYSYHEYIHMHCCRRCSCNVVASQVCRFYCLCDRTQNVSGNVRKQTAIPLKIHNKEKSFSAKSQRNYSKNGQLNTSNVSDSNHQLDIFNVSAKNEGCSTNGNSKHNKSSRKVSCNRFKRDCNSSSNSTTSASNSHTIRKHSARKYSVNRDANSVYNNNNENGNNLLRSLNAVKAITSVVQNRNYKRKLKKNLVWLFIGLVWLEGPKLINCSISHNDNDVTSVSGNETTNKIGNSQNSSRESSSGSSSNSGGGDGARNSSRNSAGPGPRSDASESKSNIKDDHFYKITTSNSSSAIQSTGGGNFDHLNKYNFMQNAMAIEQALQVHKQYQRQIFYHQQLQDRIQPRKIPVLSQKAFHWSRQHRLLTTPTISLDSEESNHAQSDSVRLESIKRQILTKLGLTEKPNVTHPLPKQFIWDTIYRADGIRSVGDFDFNDDHRMQEHVRLSATVLEPPPLFTHHFQGKVKIINDMEDIHTIQPQWRNENHSDTSNDVPASWRLYNLTTQQITDQKRQIHPKYQRKNRPQQQRQKSATHSKNSQSQRQKHTQGKASSQSQGQSQGKASYVEPDYFEGDDFFGSTQEIITFAEKGKIYKKHRLVEFSPPSNKISKQKLQIRNAEIHIRIEHISPPSSTTGKMEQSYYRQKPKEPNLKIWIFQLVGNDFSSKGFDQVATFCTSLSVNHNVLGWQKLDITETVQYWYNKHQKEKLRLLIDCTGCGNRYILHLFDRKYHHSLKSSTMSIRQAPQKSHVTKTFSKTISKTLNSNKPRKSQAQHYRYHYWHYNHHRYRRKKHAMLPPQPLGALNSSESAAILQYEEQIRNEDNISQLHLWPSSNHPNHISREAKAKESSEGISYEVGAEYHLEDRLNPNRPFLVLHTEPTRSRRVRRRAVDCSGAVHGQCCKESFYVSFKALGWDDWIIAPRGYFANYCRGDCTGPYRTPDTFQTFHAHFIEEYRKMGLLNGMQPCCAPIKFSSMSLIYYGDDGIIKRDLPKMVVDECGCP